MKTISEYTIYCTEEQTRKAYKLGAEIVRYKSIFISESAPHYIEYLNGDKYVFVIPTAEQMRIWLESQGFYFRTNTIGCSAEIDFKCIYEDNSICYPEGIIAVIDAALDYLTKNKK